MISDLQHVLNLGRCHRKIGAINSPHQRKNEEEVEVCLNCSIREKEADTCFSASHPDNKTMRPVTDQHTAYTFSAVQLLVRRTDTTEIMTTPQEYEGQWTAKANIHLEHLLGGALQRAPQNSPDFGIGV